MFPSNQKLLEQPHLGPGFGLSCPCTGSSANKWIELHCLEKLIWNLVLFTEKVKKFFYLKFLHIVNFYENAFVTWSKWFTTRPWVQS